ncbi:MAG: hypothetical protein M0Z99_00335 [Betaproteobacteria bacterium]|nr:hypothetical protein [Betaproteobacteria bacterium]
MNAKPASDSTYSDLGQSTQANNVLGTHQIAPYFSSTILRKTGLTIINTQIYPNRRAKALTQTKKAPRISWGFFMAANSPIFLGCN